MRYCPNCDRPVDVEDDYLVCRHCDIWWSRGWADLLPTEPIGDEARERAFEAAKRRAGLS